MYKALIILSCVITLGCSSNLTLRKVVTRHSFLEEIKETYGLDLALASSGSYERPTVTDSIYVSQDWLEVNIDEDFYFSRYEITNETYNQVLNDNKEVTQRMHTDYFLYPKKPIRFQITQLPPSLPAILTWGEGNLFCWFLTRSCHQNGWIPENYVFRLPTEHEWEYLVNAGAKYSYRPPPYDKVIRNIWPKEWYREQLSIGGKTPSNNWGAFDIFGNVSEWCIDHMGNLRSGGGRLHKGGSFSPVNYGVASWSTFARKVESCRFPMGIKGSIADKVGIRPILVKGGYKKLACKYVFFIPTKENIEPKIPFKSDDDSSLFD